MRSWHNVDMLKSHGMLGVRCSWNRVFRSLILISLCNSFCCHLSLFLSGPRVSQVVRRGTNGKEAETRPAQAILLAPGSDEAIAAFKQKFPGVMAKSSPNYLGTPCSEEDLRRRFQALGETIGRDEALGLVLREPLLIAMQEENLRSSWQAMLEVAKQDRAEALRVVRKRPGCLIAPAEGFKGKTLADFEAVAQMEDVFRPATETLKEIGPEGVALGAAALGLAALGAMGAKASKGSKISNPKQKLRSEVEKRDGEWRRNQVKPLQNHVTAIAIVCFWYAFVPFCQTYIIHPDSSYILY